jgi:two-component system NtrC family sensor kinase
MRRPQKRTNWKRQALTAERLRFESVRNWQTSQNPVRMDLLALGVAHEFNNILGAALGHAEWALEELNPKDMRDALEVIRVACIRCAQITKSLQGIVQPREEEKGIIPIKHMLEEVFTLWELKADRSNVSFSKKINDSKVYLDVSAFMEIFSNLIKNSFEAFSKEGTKDPKITIETKEQGPYVVLEYKDNGPGIPEAYRPYMFQPFFSTKGSISAAYSTESDAMVGEAASPQNSGLGLFLSRALAQEMGGDLRLVDTAETKGAHFSLTLPLASPPKP